MVVVVPTRNKCSFVQYLVERGRVEWRERGHRTSRYRTSMGGVQEWEDHSEDSSRGLFLFVCLFVRLGVVNS